MMREQWGSDQTKAVTFSDSCSPLAWPGPEVSSLQEDWIATLELLLSNYGGDKMDQPVTSLPACAGPHFVGQLRALFLPRPSVVSSFLHVSGPWSW